MSVDFSKHDDEEFLHVFDRGDEVQVALTTDVIDDALIVRLDAREVLTLKNQLKSWLDESKYVYLKSSYGLGYRYKDGKRGNPRVSRWDGFDGWVHVGWKHEYDMSGWARVTKKEAKHG
jgi:hypothetical protein